MSIETLQLRLDLMQTQLNWLEREIAFLRAHMLRMGLSTKPERTFESLRGIWSGVVFDEQDLQASRLKLPEDL